MTGRLLLPLLLMLAAASCGTYRRELDANPPFAPHHYRYYDVEMSWQVKRGDGLLRLTGTVTNRRTLYLRDLETTVELLDDTGKSLGREGFADFPTYLPPGRTAPLRLEFRLPAGAAPARLRFTYSYWLAEEPPAIRGYDVGPYFGHFDSPL